MHNREISEELRTARRSLEQIQGYSLVEDFYWDKNIECWFIFFSMEVEIDGNEFIPKKTFWRLAIKDKYPEGSIEIYPDADLGIKCTFQHQNYNNELEGKNYRSGKLCLDSVFGSWGRKKYSNEPRDYKNRLLWHVWRCQQWIYAASNNSLFENGDPFEFPAFPPNQYRNSLVFNEDHIAFSKWMNFEKKCGYFHYLEVEKHRTFAKDKCIITHFTNGREELKYNWGKYYENFETSENEGLWILIEKLPIKDPWELPDTFGKLFEICSEQGVDLKKILSDSYLNRRHKGKHLTIVALGFPIPEYIGKKNNIIQWITFGFPIPKFKRNGFRPNTKELWKFQLNECIATNAKIDWLRSENWSKNQITNRGRIDKNLQDSNILLVGAGAVGSTLIELFARLGCPNLTIVDSDELVAGNLSRHSLTLNHIGNNKAEMLAIKLNATFPFMNVMFHPSKIETLIRNQEDFLKQFDLVIDATAEDSVLDILQNGLKKPGQFFLSVSTSYNANRLYGYMYRENSCESGLLEDFKLKLEPWITKDNDIPKEDADLIEGIGCWHPIFPSRIDDIQMLVGAIFKKFERAYHELENSKMFVIEKIFDMQNDFKGINIIDSE